MILLFLSGNVPYPPTAGQFESDESNRLDDYNLGHCWRLFRLGLGIHLVLQGSIRQWTNDTAYFAYHIFHHNPTFGSIRITKCAREFHFFACKF